MTSLLMAFLLMLAAILSAIVPAETVPEEAQSWTYEVRGKLAHATCCGPDYLAIPEHKSWLPGIRVRVCGPGGCMTMVSTDAGPALSRQREGWIGDLAAGRWEDVCGLPDGTVGSDHDPGSCVATIRYGAFDDGPRPTLPPTDTGG